MIPVYKPFLNEEIIKYGHDALDSGWISSIGKYKQLASDLLCEKTGTKYSYLTCNGTVSCHLIAKVMKKFHPELRRVAIPNNCYVAAINAFMFDNAQNQGKKRDNFKFIPYDACSKTWNFNVSDTSSINEYNPTPEIFYVVHNLGNVVNVPELKRKYPDSVFIEDACEALFGEYDGSPVGSQSLCSSFSFYGNKNISAGEGGAVVTNEKDVYDYIKHISEQSQTQRFIHDEIGYNYRMTNVHAAILYGQLKHSDEIMENKYRVFNKYNELIKDLPLESQKETPNTKHACWMYGVKFENKEIKNKVQSGLEDLGIDTRPMFYSLGTHEHLKGVDGFFHPEFNKVSNQLSDCCLVLPSYPGLSNEEIQTVVESIKAILNEN